MMKMWYLRGFGSIVKKKELKRQHETFQKYNHYHTGTQNSAFKPAKAFRNP